MEVSTVIDEQQKVDEGQNNDEELKITKTKKRKQSQIDDGVMFTSSKKKNTKRIMLSVTKPSYTLKRGITGHDLRSLRSEHRNRLRYILRQLIRRQNWNEAAGVLSLLLKGTYKEKGYLNNRNKYWVCLLAILFLHKFLLGGLMLVHIMNFTCCKNCVNKNILQ